MFLPEVITVPSLLRALEIISEDNRGDLGTLPLRALFAKVTLKRLRLHLVIPDRQVIGSLRCLPTLTDLEVLDKNAIMFTMAFFKALTLRRDGNPPLIPSLHRIIFTGTMGAAEREAMLDMIDSSLRYMTADWS